MKIVIFTDLDGTLLHPETYSFQEALPALERLKKLKIPLIMCSSKTRAEIEDYRARMDNKDPFVSENGGGIFIPVDYFPFPLNRGDIMDGYINIILGNKYKDIRSAFIELRETTGIRVKGFGDMSIQEVARITGMTLEESQRAKKREFDEPFIFENGETRVEEFLRAIENKGFRWTRGRLFHILGENDKGKAIKILKEFFKRMEPNIITIGLGDSLNDLPLFQNVDYPVLMKKKNGEYEEGIELPHLIRDGMGPAGWNQIVLKLIKALRN